jgi:hypothetical protein
MHHTTGRTGLLLWMKTNPQDPTSPTIVAAIRDAIILIVSIQYFVG